MSGFKLGAASLKELTGVHPQLVATVKRAIEVSEQDFTVHDGIRTIEEQKRFVAQGVSKTMDSKHLRGLAVDLVPWIDGKPRWWWPQIYSIAAAMYVAARELNAKSIYWGAAWDRPLLELTPPCANMSQLADQLRKAGLAYNERHPGKDFPDGPHFEIKP